MILHIARTGKNVTLDMISSKIEREREREKEYERECERERKRTSECCKACQFAYDESSSRHRRILISLNWLSWI